MDNKELIPGLENLVKEFLNAQSFELVELSLFRQGRSLVIRILAERPEGGISIGECALVNRRLGELLEEEGIIQESYILEVNSPGLDRPLKTRQDFSRCIGRRVKFFLIEPINGKIEFEGSILNVSEDGLEAQTPEGGITIPLSKIKMAKQIV
jgi:ribosome maturation factor RimP